MNDDSQNAITPETITPPRRDDLVDMLVEQARFQGTPEMKAITIRLLESGYTLSAVAARLDCRTSTLWAWMEDTDVQEALARGKAIRQTVVGEGLQEAAGSAVEALRDVVTDGQVAPKDRIKAAEVILDRSGLVSDAGSGESATMVTVDVDFDERLARIVAGSATRRVVSGGDS